MVSLRDEIERLREQLCFLLLSKELTDIEVVTYSQKLDELLAQYQKEMNLREQKSNK